MNKDSALEKLQKEEKEALRLFINFCDKNKIIYYLRGGSALGAVKYGGMIPWDDDIDVIIPRKDYNRLINCFPESIGNYIFQHYQRNKKINCYFARLYLSEEQKNNLGLPANNDFGLVLIDILPIDGMPSSCLLRSIIKLRVNFLRLLASVHTLDHKGTVVKRSGIKKMIPELLNKLHVHKLYKQIDIYKKLECVYSSTDMDSAEIVGVLAGSKGGIEVFPKKWLGDGRFLLFEGFQARVPEYVDKYLEKLFGNDYMERNPKESERIQKHFEGKL